MTKLFLRFFTLFVAAIFLAFAACGYIPPKETRQMSVYPEQLENEPTIRVLTLAKTGPMTIAMTGPFRVKATHLNGKIETAARNFALSLTVMAHANGVQLGRDSLKRVTIFPTGNTTFILSHTGSDGKKVSTTFSCALTFIRREGAAGVVQVIASLGLEQYLTGVIPNEMPIQWHPQALKAQAVASRTYALYHIKTRTDKDYDVRKTIMSQVWKPSARKYPRAMLAVNSTRGIIATENYRLFPTYFHQRCGGQTADARFVFGKGNITALLGRKCKFCRSIKGKEPKTLKPDIFSIRKDDITNRLKARKLISGAVKNIRALDENNAPMNVAGRVYAVEITTANGKVEPLSIQRFRHALGTTDLASSWFAIVESNATHISFEVHGGGHGVGMCQYGTRYLAQTQKLPYENIIKEYYPGSKLIRLY